MGAAIDADVRRRVAGAAAASCRESTLRVEAAGYHGNADLLHRGLFRGPSRSACRVRRDASVDRFVTALATIFGALIMIAAAVLARRHLRSGRGDRRGAFRTAAMMFVCQAAGWLICARHYGDRADRDEQPESHSGVHAVFRVGRLAVLPRARALRAALLAGAADRLDAGCCRAVCAIRCVGRDVLIGVAAGTIGALLIAAPEIIAQATGRSVQTPYLPKSSILLGTRYSAGGSDSKSSAPRLIDALQCIVHRRVLQDCSCGAPGS